MKDTAKTPPATATAPARDVVGQASRLPAGLLAPGATNAGGTPGEAGATPAPLPEPAPPRTCPFHFPKRAAGAGRFQFPIISLSMLLLAGGAILIVWRLYHQQSDLYQSVALQGATIQMETIKQFRQLYSDEVASRARAFGLELAHDYAKKDSALPLPATLTIELGEAINRARPGAIVRLYSDYPFPWRKQSGGPKDAFETEALRRLKQQPDEPFYQFEEFRGRPSLRFAVADRMQTSCMACHNSRADSPKTDWKEGDVRGVLEFVRPLDNEGAAVAQGRASLNWTFGAVAAMFSAGIAGLGLAMRRVRRASASLRRSEENVRAVIANALDAVVAMDPVGLITDWNPRAEAIFGWTRQEAVGRAMADTIIPHRYREGHERGVRHFLATGEGPILNSRIEITALRRDGREFPVELSVTSLKAGTTVTFNAFIRDISDRKLAEAELEKANKSLVETSRLAGRAEVATGVLHNVGNVLNSVNVASSCVAEGIKNSKAGSLARVANLLHEHEADLGAFLTTDPKGKQVPGFLSKLAGHLAGEQAAALKELAQLQKNIEHIRDIIAMQQGFATVSGAQESLKVADLMEDALKMNASALLRHDIEIIREFSEVPPITTEKHKVLQILVNLVSNAKGACAESGRTDKQMSVRVANGNGRVKISVTDNGIGIPAENLNRIFNHGFTTKKDGHGFGLHSGALAVKELGGTLSVHSDGPGKGATFTLELPCQKK